MIAGGGECDDEVQGVLFHSLHEELIVLGEGKRSGHQSAGVLSQVTQAGVLL